MEIEIHASCYSEKADVSIGFGITCESKSDNLSEVGYEWIFEGISDSFWENYEEFEAGIFQAKIINANNSSITFRQALYAVFGNFDLEFEVNGVLVELDNRIDVDEIMYDLLEN